VTKYIDAEIGADGDRACAFQSKTAAPADYLPGGQRTSGTATLEKAPETSVCESGKTQNPIVQSLCRNMKELQK
jgi:hypothetical protein